MTFDGAAPGVCARQGDAISAIDMPNVRASEARYRIERTPIPILMSGLAARPFHSAIRWYQGCPRHFFGFRKIKEFKNRWRHVA